MSDNSFFRSKGSSSPQTGQDQTALDADPSAESGSNTIVTAPAWEKYVTNTVSTQHNQAAVRAENEDARRIDLQNAYQDRSNQEVWKGVAGKLLRKVGRNPAEALDPEQFVDHPTGGAEARKSLWDRERRGAQDEHQALSLQLSDPAFKARKLKDDQRFEIEGKGNARAQALGAQGWDMARVELEDQEYQGFKRALEQDSTFDADKGELETKAHAAKLKAFQLDNTEPEAWFQQRRTSEINANRGQITQEAQAGQAQADEAAVSLQEESKALAAEMSSGVTAERSKQIQARQAQMQAGKAGIEQAKQGEQAKIEGVKQAAAEDATKPPGDKAFFGVTDTISGIWDALKGLGSAAPAAFYQASEGLVHPDQYSESAKAAFAEADAYNAEMQAKTAENQKAGTSTSTGETFRELGSSLGSSVVGMGTQLGVKIPLTLAGVGTGAAVGLAGGPAAPVTSPGGAVVGGLASWAASEAPALAAGAAVAYRMAGAAFLRDAFQHIKQVKGRELTAEESKDYYEKLLPIAQNTGMAESLPEALGNSISMKGVAAIAGLGKKAVAGAAKKTMAEAIQGKAVAAAKMVLGELGTETITAQYQTPDQQKADAIAKGEDPSKFEPDWSVKGLAKSVGDVGPQVLAQSILMGGLGAGANLASRPFRNGEKEVTTPPPVQETPEQVEASVNNHLATIDPNITPATQEEIAGARGIANPVGGHKSLAESVQIERELKIAEEAETAEYAAADEAIAQATLSSDKGAITVAEEARDRLPTKRADAARGMLKVMSGSSVEDLLPSERVALGFQEAEGEPKLQTDEELKKNGLSESLVYAEKLSGQPIITEEGLKRLAAVSPAAARLPKMTEDAAKKAAVKAFTDAAKAKFSAESQNGAEGELQTGLPASAGVVPLETNAPAEFIVQMRDGPPIKVQAATAQDAENEASAQFEGGANQVLQGQTVAVTPPSNDDKRPKGIQGTDPANVPQRPSGEEDGASGNDSSVQTATGGDPAQTKAPVAAQDPAAIAAKARGLIAAAKDDRIKSITPEVAKVAQENGIEITPDSTIDDVMRQLNELHPTVKLADVPTEEKNAIRMTVQGVVAKWKSNPAVNAVLDISSKHTTKAAAVDGKAQINTRLLAEDATTARLTPEQTETWLARVLFEELHHVSQIQAFNDIYEASGSPLKYDLWLGGYLDTLLKEFKSIKGEGDTRTLYEAAMEAYGPDLAGGSPFKQVAEINRMILQDMLTGNPTEATKAAINNPDLRTFFQSAIDALKKIIEGFRGDNSKFSKDLIDNLDRVEALLSQYALPNTKTDSQPRAGSSKSDSAQPTKSSKGAGNAPTAAQNSNSEAPSGSGAVPPRSEGVSPPLAVGTRVEFVNRSGVTVQGEITSAKDGKIFGTFEGVTVVRVLLESGGVSMPPVANLRVLDKPGTNPAEKLASQSPLVDETQPPKDSELVIPSNAVKPPMFGKAAEDKAKDAARMTRKEFTVYFEKLRESTLSKHRFPQYRFTDEANKFIGKYGWQEWSRQRGYSEADITEHEEFLGVWGGGSSHPTDVHRQLQKRFPAETKPEPVAEEEAKPSPEELPTVEGLLSAIVEEIAGWVKTGTNNGSRAMDRNWERGAIRRYIAGSSLIQTLIDGKLTGKEATAKINIKKATAFAEIVAAVEKYRASRRAAKAEPAPPVADEPSAPADAETPVEATAKEELAQYLAEQSAILSDRAFQAAALAELKDSLQDVEITVQVDVAGQNATAEFKQNGKEIVSKLKTDKSSYAALAKCLGK